MRERIDDIRRQRDDYRREASLGFDAVNALVDDVVTWVSHGEVKIGYAKLDAPHGGIIIVRENGYASSLYADEWFNRVSQYLAPHHADNSEYNEWLFVQQTARDIKATREAAMDAKYGPMVAVEPSSRMASTGEDY